MNGAGKPAPAAEVPRSPTSTTQVKHFRQIVLWPVYLMPAGDGAATEDHWAQIAEAGADNPWREVDDEFTGDPLEFQERHYNEFVAFLPPVQRFLYGQGLGKSVHRIYGESPIRVMRRSDIARVRVTLERDNLPLVFEIAHVDLYFFFDIDVAILALEIYASDLSLGVAQDVMFQFGRVYPSYWEPDGRAGHCPCRVEWLSSTGEALSASDYENKQKFLGFVCEHRAPSVAAHWDYLL
jgi:hypothetical protein